MRYPAPMSSPRPRLLPVAVLAALAAWSAHGPARAGESEVVKVDVRADGPGTYTFDVTLRHADSGWDHYADRWDVLGPGGEVLGTRVLAHPHVHEQPFTRSLSGVAIPAGVDAVTIRAHDTVHGDGPGTYRVAVPR